MSGSGSSAQDVDRPALVLLAHGSRHPDLPASLGRLVVAVAELAEAAGTPLSVRAAYLDLAQPDLGRLSRELAALGHRRVVCVPTLFTSAFHAEVDVPESARVAAHESGLELQIAGIVGTGDEVLDVLLDALAEEAADASDNPGDPSAPSDLILFSVGSSSASANAAVDDLGRRLGDRLGARVDVAFGTRDPRGTEVLAQRVAAGARPSVLPLFVSPGVLLDPMRAAAELAGVRMLPPLETRLAPVVLARYRAAVGGG